MSGKKVKGAEPVEPVRKGPPMDEFHGQGGSYVIEPGAEARTLVARTDAGEQAVQTAEGGV